MVDQAKKPEEVKPEEMKKTRKKKESKPDGISIEIKCTAATREKEAEKTFLELMDGRGGVLAVNPECGGSIYFDSLAKFPKVNRPCTCGNHKHYIVKYTFI